jgi:hypothetical protein
MFNSDPFRNQESSIVKRKRVESQDRMNAMREIAPKHGVVLTVLNKPGEKYTHEGRSYDLKHDEYYVEISSGFDLTNFWKEVDEIAPVKKDALSMLIDEFVTNLKNGTVEKADLVHLKSILDERIAVEEERAAKYNIGGKSN